jgi:hypothetical protein
MSIPAIPKGFHTIAPNIIVDDAEKAVEFLKKALDEDRFSQRKLFP